MPSAPFRGTPPVTALRDKIAQLLFFRIGSNMTPPRTVAEDEVAVRRMLDTHALGGLVLFNGRWPETPAVLERLQAHSRFPLLVTSDLERGAGQQVQGLTVFPHAAAFAHLGAEAEAAVEAFGRATAREARAAGIHATFAPVADVSRNPRNPIIATRAFGDAPDTVARLAESFVRGCRAENLLSCAKHFPGHGNTDQDSHAEMLRINDTREDLERYDFPPFRSTIAAGTEMVMVAHGIFPALDPTGTPASFSRPILNDLLRHELGFDGLVISDSLRMGGAHDAGHMRASWAVDMLRAGVDVLLDLEDIPGVIDAVVHAVEMGVLAEERIDEALRRVWKLKQQALATPAPLLDEAMRAMHRDLAADVARGAVRTRGEVTLAPEDDVCAILMPSIPLPPQPLGALLAEHVPRLTYHELGPDADEAAYAAVHRRAIEADRVLLAFIVRPAAWHAFGLRPAQAAFAETLVRDTQPVVASLGVPSILDPFDGVPTVCTFSDVRPSQQALVQVLTQS